MSGDVSLDSAGDEWPPTASAPRASGISWIQVIRAVVQFYCILCHCVFLMLVAVGMFAKELFRRFAVHWKSWYNDVPLALRTIRVTVMSKIASVPKLQLLQLGDEEEEDEEEEEVVELSQEQSESPEVAEVNTSDGVSAAPTVSASTSEGYSSSSHPESPGGVVTETDSSASLPIRPQVQQAAKRIPCSISAVVEDQYACRLNRSSSSSAVSLDELDESSDDDGANGFDEASRSSGGPSKSGSGSGSWKLKSAFHRASVKANDHQNRTSKPKAAASQAPSTEKNKFSLGPVISSLRRVCSRTLSVINKEFTECMSAQNHKTRSKKSKTPAAPPTSVASQQSRELHQQPAPETSRDAFRDLAVPEQRTSVQSSWNDVCSSGGTQASSGSDSLGEMHRGLLDSFSETESSDFPHRQTVDLPFGDTVSSDEKPTPYSVGTLGAKKNLEKGDSDWTARKSQSNAFFTSESAGANTFSGFF